MDNTSVHGGASLPAKQPTPFAVHPPSNASSSERNETLARLQIATLSVIFVLTVAGNASVLVVIVSRRIKMARMYYFLLHLCVSDLITAFFNVLPQLVWIVTHRFRGGNALCKAVKYLQLLGPYLSSYVLTVTAIDRYQAICFPMSNCTWTPRRSRQMIAAAWTVALLCCVPQIFIFSYQQVEGFTYDCWGTFVQPWGERAYVTWYAVSVFFVPLLILVFTYVSICKTIWTNVQQKTHSRKTTLLVGRSYRFRGRGQIEVRLDDEPSVSVNSRTAFVLPRSHHSMRGLSRTKIKTIKVTVVIIACYVVCSSPFLCVQLWAQWNPNVRTSDIWRGPVVTILMLLASLNSCMNPWIYIIFNRSHVGRLFSRSSLLPQHNKKLSFQLPGMEGSNTTSRSSPTENDSGSLFPLTYRDSTKSHLIACGKAERPTAICSTFDDDATRFEGFTLQ